MQCLSKRSLFTYRKVCHSGRAILHLLQQSRISAKTTRALRSAGIRAQVARRFGHSKWASLRAGSSLALSSADGIRASGHRLRRAGRILRGLPYGFGKNGAPPLMLDGFVRQRPWRPEGPSVPHKLL
jgi:hypothetical protein